MWLQSPTGHSMNFSVSCQAQSPEPVQSMGGLVPLPQCLLSQASHSLTQGGSRPHCLREILADKMCRHRPRGWCSHQSQFFCRPFCCLCREKAKKEEPSMGLGSGGWAVEKEHVEHPGPSTTLVKQLWILLLFSKRTLPDKLHGQVYSERQIPAWRVYGGDTLELEGLLVFSYSDAPAGRSCC